MSPRLITRRRFIRLAAMASGMGLGTGLYTWRWEPHWLQIVERSLPVTNLPAALRGKRLAHLSDLHIGPQVDDAFLIRTFERVRNLAPDIVLYTGDFTSYNTDLVEHTQRVFAHLPLGQIATVGILGNHDYGPGWSHPEIAARVSRLATEAGVQILRNETANIDGLQIVGLDDLWAGQFDPSKTLPLVQPGNATLVLSHNPDTVDLPGWENYRGWILSGHTHGGQCKPPFLPPPLLPVKNRRYTSGEFELDGDRRMYISRGVGHLTQVRFNVRPEVTIFRLERA